MKKITLLFTILTASFGFSQNGGDTCGAAVAVTLGSFTQTSITGTGAELGTGAGSAWFVYTPTEDASIVVSSCNGGSDTYLAIGTGTCGSLNLAGSNDDFCPTTEGGSAFASQVSIPVTAGTDYYIEWSNRWSSGPFNWSIEEIACPEVGSVFIEYLTDVSGDFIWSDVGGLSYEWEVQPDGTAQGTVGAPASGSTTTSQFSTGNVLQANTPYDIFIQTNCGSDGTSDYIGPLSFTTNALPPPSNDLLENAIAVVCDGNYTGDTTNANFTETDAPDGFGASNDTQNIWYSYTGSGTEEDVTVDLCASGYDTAFIVYTGTSGNLVAVGGNDDNNAICGSGFRSYGSFLSDGSTTYYINVNGYAGTTGLVDMTISCASTTPPPSNDEVGDAVALTLDASVQGTTEGATQDGSQDQPACDLFGSIADVWYTVTLAEEGDLQIVTTISGNSDQANVTVYTSDSGLEDDEVTAFCSDDSGGETISGNLVAGTYYIRVWSDGVASTRTEGTFDIVANFTGLSINDFDNPKLFQYYPNPVKNVLTLNGQRNIESIYIYNMLGQEVMYSQPQALDSQLDMSKLQSGTYFMQVTVGTTIQTVRVIKQ